MSQIAVASPAKDRKRLTLAVEWAMTHQWLRAKTEPSRRTAGRRWLQKHSHDCLFLRSRIFGPSRFSVWMIKAGNPANSVQPCSSVGGSLNVGFWQKGRSSKIFWFMSMVAPCATPHLKIWRTGPWFASGSDVGPTGFLMPISTPSSDLGTHVWHCFPPRSASPPGGTGERIDPALTAKDLCWSTFPIANVGLAWRQIARPLVQIRDNAILWLPRTRICRAL